MDDLEMALVVLLEEELSDEECERESEAELFKQRGKEGCFQLLVLRHLNTNECKFRQYFRLTPVLFDYVLNFIRVDITSKPTNRVPAPISAEHKLAIFLRFLATGESFRSLSFQYRVSHSWISYIIKQVSTSIVNRMIDILPQPTEDFLRTTSLKFMSMWNFPNCVGAIDGKHIRIKAPRISGSLYFNYKEFYSIVLLAIVDADCKFIAVDIGSYGREGDAGIFLKSKIGRKIQNDELKFPAPRPFPGSTENMPYVFVGDEAFALHKHLMKPYPRKQTLQDKSKAIYNYRLSRARRATENAFGIFCAYFRLFFQPIATAPEVTDNLVTSACILHNILRDANIAVPIQVGNNDNLPLPENNLVPLNQNNVRGANIPSQIREKFKEYFNGIGAVEWQEQHYINN